jgi:hypothetical protein
MMNLLQDPRQRLMGEYPTNRLAVTLFGVVIV